MKNVLLGYATVFLMAASAAHAEDSFFPSYDNSEPTASDNLNSFPPPEPVQNTEYPRLDTFPTMDNRSVETRLAIDPDTSLGGDFSDGSVSGNIRLAPDFLQ